MKKLLLPTLFFSLISTAQAQNILNIPGDIANDRKVNQLILAVEAAYEQGSLPSWYLSQSHQNEIRTLIQSGKTTELDQYINSKLLTLAKDLNTGRIAPDKISEARIVAKQFQQANLVNDYISDKITASQLVESVVPQNYIYSTALSTLKKLRSMKEQGLLAAKPAQLALVTVKEKAKAPQSVSFLRSRLNDLGYLNNTSNMQFDSELDLLVKAFQRDHNLKEDGIVGKDSWPLLQRSVDELITQATLSLERTRWNPDKNNGEFIYVNFNNQQLEYYKNNIIDLTSKVIIGRIQNGAKEARKTPLLVDYVKNMVLNTKWTVPVSIFTIDKLPLLRANPGYVAANNMYVEDNATGKQVDPFSVDWKLDAKTLLKKYSLVQMPGPKNALGRMKFFLSNKISIYLHDTNERNLFSQSLRLISSGCVRVEKPFDLAARVLEGTKWTKEEILNFTEYAPVQATDETWIKMAKNVPVYFMSMTVIQNAEGRIVSFNDHYGVDSEMYPKLLASNP